MPAPEESSEPDGDFVLHNVIKAIKSSMASRGSEHHYCSAVEFQTLPHVENGQIQYKTQSYRWFILFLLCGLILNVLVAQVGFVAFVSQISLAYGVSKWPVTLLMVLPGIVYAPVTYITTVLLARWKMHHVLKLAALLQLVGSWTRVLSFIRTDFWLLGLGTGIFFISMPLVFNSISLVAKMWFSDEERAQVTAIAGLMVPLGCLLGLVMTATLWSDVEEASQSQCIQSFELIVSAQNGLFSFSSILFMIFFRKKPDTPPSKLALVVRHFARQGIRDDIAALSKNRNFILNLVAFSLIWGNYITFRNVLTPLLAVHFSMAEITLVGIIYVVFGAIGCYIMGAFLYRTKKFLLAVRLVNITLFSIFALSIFVLPIGKLWITCTFALFGGLLNVPILPASYQYAGSLAQKFPPIVVNGIMMSAAQTWGCIASLITTQLLQYGQEYGLAFMATTILVALACTSLMKTQNDMESNQKHSVMVTDEDDDDDESIVVSSSSIRDLEDLQSSHLIFHA